MSRHRGTADMVHLRVDPQTALQIHRDALAAQQVVVSRDAERPRARRDPVFVGLDAVLVGAFLLSAFIVMVSVWPDAFAGLLG